MTNRAVASNAAEVDITTAWSTAVSLPFAVNDAASKGIVLNSIWNLEYNFPTDDTHYIIESRIQRDGVTIFQGIVYEYVFDTTENVGIGVSAGG